MLADFTTVVSALISFVSFCIEGTYMLSVAIADFILPVTDDFPCHYNPFWPREFLTRTPHKPHLPFCTGSAWIHGC